MLEKVLNKVSRVFAVVFRGIRKRWVLNRLSVELGPALASRYGPDPECTVARVRRTVESLGVSLEYVEYAVAMVCEDVAYLEWRCADDESLDHAAAPEMRGRPYRDQAIQVRSLTRAEARERLDYLRKEAVRITGLKNWRPERRPDEAPEVENPRGLPLHGGDDIPGL